MADTKYIHVLVSGIVQGVWFRQSTKQVADSLGIRGYAKNLPDGKVEVLACGSGDAIEKLIDYLHQGPENARVEEVNLIATAPNSADQRTGFDTL